MLTCTHTYANIYTHTHTQTHALARTNTHYHRTHKHKHTTNYLHHIHKQTCVKTNKQIHDQANGRPNMQIQRLYTYKHTHTHIHMYTHPQMDRQTDAHHNHK